MYSLQIKLTMKQNPQPEIIDNLVRCLSWTCDDKLVTPDDVSQFIRSIAIDEPDPILASILYQKYCEAVNEAALALTKKFC